MTSRHLLLAKRLLLLLIACAAAAAFCAQLSARLPVATGGLANRRGSGGSSSSTLTRHQGSSLAGAGSAAMAPHSQRRPVCVGVVGSGLAGLSAALEASQALAGHAGARVVLFEKNAALGGNSAKASSGINALTASTGDSEAAFADDTTRSGGGLSDAALVQALVVRGRLQSALCLARAAHCMLMTITPSLLHIPGTRHGSRLLRDGAARPRVCCARRAAADLRRRPPRAPQSHSVGSLRFLEGLGLNLSSVVRLGGHSFARTHANPSGAPTRAVHTSAALPGRARRQPGAARAAGTARRRRADCLRAARAQCRFRAGQRRGGGRQGGGQR